MESVHQIEVPVAVEDLDELSPGPDPLSAGGGDEEGDAFPVRQSVLPRPLEIPLEDIGVTDRSEDRAQPPEVAPGVGHPHGVQAAPQGPQIGSQPSGRHAELVHIGCRRPFGVEPEPVVVVEDAPECTVDRGGDDIGDGRVVTGSGRTSGTGSDTGQCPSELRHPPACTGAGAVQLRQDVVHGVVAGGGELEFDLPEAQAVACTPVDRQGVVVDLAQNRSPVPESEPAAPALDLDDRLEGPASDDPVDDPQCVGRDRADHPGPRELRPPDQSVPDGPAPAAPVAARQFERPGAVPRPFARAVPEGDAPGPQP